MKKQKSKNEPVIVDAVVDAVVDVVADAVPEITTLEETPVISEDEIMKLAHHEGLVDASMNEEEYIIEAASEDEIEKKHGLDLNSQEELMASIESILFMSDKPITLSRIRSIVNPEVALSVYRTLVNKLILEFSRSFRGIEISEINKGFQLRTKSSMAQVLRRMVKTQPLKLTATSLETLAVIAYKQPITKDDIDKIRGVDSGYMLRNLMEKRMAKILGRSDLPGRPILYGTSHEFLELFNLKDLESLPPLHEIEAMVANSEIGDDSNEESQLKNFSEMVLTQSTNLFEESGLDEELESLRSEIASISTSTDFIDLQKQREKLLTKIAAPSLAEEDKLKLNETLLELDRQLLLLTSPVEFNEDIIQEIIDAQTLSANVTKAEAESLMEDKTIPKLSAAEVEAIDQAIGSVFADSKELN